MATLVLSVIGDDRPGLVDALAGPIARHGGNWDHSNLARLAGKFAGIVVATVPDDRIDRLRADLDTLHDRHHLEVRVTMAAVDGEGSLDPGTIVQLHLIGQDRTGIIREIAAALAASGVSIDELETSTSSAPMSGEQLFEARAVLRLPAEADLDALRSTLEDIANELMVDLDVSAHPGRR